MLTFIASALWTEREIVRGGGFRLHKFRAFAYPQPLPHTKLTLQSYPPYISTHPAFQPPAHQPSRTRPNPSHDAQSTPSLEMWGVVASPRFDIPTLSLFATSRAIFKKTHYMLRQRLLKVEFWFAVRKVTFCEYHSLSLSYVNFLCFGVIITIEIYF